jgi:2-dehydropantoate 2-reductase
MKIVIMGAGAMGSLFGGLLSFSGEEVWLVDVRKENVDLINAVGITMEREGKIQIIGASATTDPASIGKADLVMLMVKTYHTEQAVSDALVLQHDDTVFLSLQNGLGNEEVICKKVDRKKVLVGVTGHGATLLGPGHICHAGKGKTYLGALDPSLESRAHEIARIFQEAEIETEVTSNIEEHIWDKLFANVGINALTALTDMKNGDLLDYPETLRLMEVLVTEAVEVAKKKGVRIEGDPVERTKQAAEATRKNRSSMGQDFDYRRQTEIDAINGALVREAERLGVAAPVNQAFTDLVKIIQERFSAPGEFKF